jgi:membrane protease YdiL (CAAX protease family)
MAKLGIYYSLFVFLVQFPFVIWYAQGKFPIHPIVILLPLVGLLNTCIEKRGAEGLGLWLVKADRGLFLALIFGALTITGGAIALRVAGSVLRAPDFTSPMIWALFKSFIVSVFILALWEELLNRGYIQTRLQAAWGFMGVIVSSFLFASMHIPSTLLDYDNDLLRASLRFAATGLAGLALGYVYWRTGSVLTSIAIHGFNNFSATALLPLIGGVTTEQLLYRQPVFWLAWLFIQVGLVMIICHFLYKQVDDRPDRRTPRDKTKEQSLAGNYY